MVYTGHVFYAHLQLLGIELYLRVGHLNRLKRISLLCQCLFLVLEVLYPIGQIRTFDLLASEIVNLLTRLHYIFFAEANQAQMLVKVFLFPHDSGLLNLKSLSILKLDLCSLLQNHVDDPVEIFVNLSHDLDLSFFHFLP